MSKPLDVRALLASASSAAPSRPSSSVEKEDDLTYDLGHLYAYDPSPVDETALADDASTYLIQAARDNVQLLTNRLYGLLEGADSKEVIQLPPPTLKLPREKPLPEDKPLTRWEKFAKAKGIVKKKRSKMVWDELNQHWAPRWGYGKANNAKDHPDNWVIEHKPGDDPTVDPFEKRGNERKEKVNKQKRQEERNRLEAAHAAAVGSKGSGSLARPEQKAYLKQAIRSAQVSTASVGRFDKKLANEPSKTAGKRKNYETGVGSAEAERDAKRTASVVAKMFPESGTKHAQIIDRTIAAKQAKLAQESSNRAARASGGAKAAKGKKGDAKGKAGGKQRGK
jgi:regulator of ribosome biosynthesis